MKRTYKSRPKGLRAWLARPQVQGYSILAVGIIMALSFNFLAALDSIGIVHFELDIDLEAARQPPSIKILSKLLQRQEQDSAPVEPATVRPRLRPGSTVETPADSLAETPASPVRHVLGTNRRGQDMLALMVHGTKAFAFPGLVAVLISLILGLAFGLLEALYRGPLSRLGDGLASLIHSIPRLLILLIVGIVSHFNIYWIMVCLGIINFPKIAGSIKSKVTQLERMQFIEAARELGMSRWRIVFKHILWTNARHLLFIQAAFGMADAIFAETTLSYLSFGANEASWGRLIVEGSDFIASGQYWMAALPAAGVIITILGYYLIGDGLTAIIQAKENLG